MLKLYSWNVNGLRAVCRKGDFLKFIKTEDPDILCLQEIKATPDQIPLEEDCPQYKFIWNPATEKKGYSGTLVLTKKMPLKYELNFNSQITNHYLLKDSYGDSNQEGRLMTLEFEQFILVNVYTPNSKGDLSRLDFRENAWDPAFRYHAQNLAKSQKPIFLCGDFNVAHQAIDLANPKANVGKHGFTDEERRGFSNLLDGGFLDSFRYYHPQQEAAYTWWSHWAASRARNVGWRLDYWLADSRSCEKIQAATIHHQIMGSDHCPISLNLNL